MRKLTKAHFNYLAKNINKHYLAQEKIVMEDMENTRFVINFSRLMSARVMSTKHSTPAVQEHIQAIMKQLFKESTDKEYKHFNHSFNCFMKRLCAVLKAQNKAFNETQFRKACTKGSIQ